jgi:hypothetical protein
MLTITHLVGIGGFQGVGKTTAANILVRQRGFTRAPLAEALREELAWWFPETLKALRALLPNAPPVEELLRTKPLPPIVRALLQDFGTDRSRVLGLDYWILRWLDRLPRALGLSGELSSIDRLHHTLPWTISGNRAGSRALVIDDVRFDAEIDWLLGAGGIYVELSRPGHGPGEHRSEHPRTPRGGTPNVYYLENWGSLINLERTIVGWAGDVIPPRQTWVLREGESE